MNQPDMPKTCPDCGKRLDGWVTFEDYEEPGDGLVFVRGAQCTGCPYQWEDRKLPSPERQERR